MANNGYDSSSSDETGANIMFLEMFESYQRKKAMKKKEQASMVVHRGASSQRCTIPRDRSIAVNGKILPIDPTTFTLHDGGTIIDLGTTLAYLVEEAHVPFIRAVTVSLFVTPFISYGNHLAEVFPIVSLNFAASASMVLKLEEYLTCSWCTMQWLSEHFAIIFYLVLKDKIIVYNLAHQRIGWANYDCSSPINRPRQWVGLGQTGL
ncbi:unnamed protein product [Prunus brigantina]